MIAMQSSLALGINLLFVPCVLGHFMVGNVFDAGFEDYFKTNLKEVENYPLKFDNPLPKWLRGTLIRNGLGRFEVGPRSFSHAFDAFGKLSSWRFPGNGSAFFSTKFIQSDFYKKSVETNSIYPYLMFDNVKPPYSVQEMVEAMSHKMGNMNVNVYQIKNNKSKQNEFIIMNDCWNVYEIEPSKLQTLQSITPKIPDQTLNFMEMLSSAHPLPEPGTDNYLDFLTSYNFVPGGKNKIQLMRMTSANDRQQVAEFYIDSLPYMHSFSVTQHYAILFVMPFTMNMEKMLTSFVPLESIDWSNTDPVIVYVINLKTGDVKQLKTENGFSMHHINSFEMGKSKIVVDMPVYKNPDAVLTFQMDIIRNVTARNKPDILARLTRYVIDLDNNDITIVPYYTSNKVPIASRIDMPSINENYRFKNYCFAYGSANKIDDVTLGKFALAKKDLCGNSTDLVWYVPNQYAAEAWFVPFPDGIKEDDGYLLTPVFDGEKRQSYLAVIDARTMKTINSAVLPISNPMTTHGRFFYDIY